MVESWLFIGNPGVGKSTLLNCLAQRVIFTSGLSFGGGLTKDVETYVDAHHGIIYTDTPGLADGVAERVAADAITRALGLCASRLKLCFVIRLQANTVVGQDLVTIERVLDSLYVPDVPFGIIINCVGKRLCDQLRRDPGEVKRIIALVNSGKYTTPHILVIPEIQELLEAENRVVSLPKGTRTYLERFPTTSIPVERIGTIYVDGFSSSVEQTKRSVSALERDKHALHEKQEELTWKKPEFWKIAASIVGVIGTIVQIAL